MKNFYRTKLILVTLFIFVSISLYAGSENDIDIIVDQYISALSLFCNSTNDEIRDNYESKLLFEIFDPVEKTLIEYDLFNSKYLHTSFTANDYLTDIKNNYSEGNFHIEFNNVVHVACIDRYDGGQYSLVTIDKTLFWNNKSKSIKLVLLIDVSSSDIHISEIYSVERFNTYSINCKLDSKSISDTLAELNKQAEIHLKRNEILEAKAIYVKTLAISGDNSKTTDKIKQIDSLITKDYLIAKIDLLLKTDEYNICENAIRDGLKSYPNSLELKSRLDLCLMNKNNAQYQEYKKTGDANFALENYTSALNYYNLAKSIINNSELMENIKKCEYLNSPQFVKDQILAAKKLASNGKLAKAFLILFKIESNKNSAYFDGETFYIMASVCAGNYGHIKDHFNLKQSELCHMTNYYTIKALQKKNLDAEYLWKEILNKKTRYCE